VPDVIEYLLSRRHCQTPDDYRNALKEIIQEITLLGLYRGNFFDKAAFYGGSALRIFHQLDRFSEDLDFSLSAPDPAFSILPYIRFIRDELQAFGFETDISKKEKSSVSPIESAFIKAGTLIHFMKIGLAPGMTSGVPSNEILKVKLEIDKTPPGEAEYEIKYQLNPIPYHVRLFTLPCLCAGKIHALLCRGWSNNRMKGRDLYDYVWYLAKKIPCNLAHLEAKMTQTGQLSKNETLTPEAVKQLLYDKLTSIDYTQAQHDVLPFIKDPDKITIWSETFFKTITRDSLILE
jgi:predicted nucleotidyltransferase component of viral defense system